MGDALGHTSGVVVFPVHRGALRWAFRGLGAGLVLGTLLGCAGLTVDSAGADSAEADSAAEPAAPLDVLLVFDTSGSMTEEGGALVLGADDIVAALGEEDWRFGITTTSANYASGPTSGVDPGEAGTLVAAAIVPDGALAWRIESGGRSFVYATDVEHDQDNPEFLRFCEGTDLLAHDAQYTDEEYAWRKGWGHSTWKHAVRVARAAAVGQLALIHHDPQREDGAVAEIERLAAGRLPGLYAAREGQSVTL